METKEKVILMKTSVCVAGTVIATQSEVTWRATRLTIITQEGAEIISDSAGNTGSKRH